MFLNDQCCSKGENVEKEWYYLDGIRFLDMGLCNNDAVGRV